MPSPQNAAAFALIQRQLAILKEPDATPLMITWMQIIREDNRRGVLAGLDKDGLPMIPVTYRPVEDVEKRINIRTSKSAISARIRHNQRWNRMHDLVLKGHGFHGAGLHNNLRSSEYRRLDGPPLAPRYQFSRVISNLVTEYWPLNKIPGNTHFEAVGWWDDVVAKDGVTKFLNFHFNGEPLGRNGPSITRDLRGIRPEGRQELMESFDRWWEDLVLSLGMV